MPDKNLISAYRYGFGFGGTHASTAAGLMKEVRSRDKIAQEFQTNDIEEAVRIYAEIRDADDDIRNGVDGAKERREAAGATLRQQGVQTVRSTFMRSVYTQAPFRERLVHFWLDHFTVSAKNRRTRLLIPPFIDKAIRPNISGSFSDLLQSAALHPAMLIYLDQQDSIGPNSKVGKQREKGLNENLARELIELHTLGVNGTYTQTDVRELAKLLTGIRFLPKRGVVYARRQAEPGSETVLGKTYHSDAKARAAIDEFLVDVSLRADTARHLSQKLAIHFIGDGYSQDLIENMVDAYLGSGGNLSETYKAMLDHADAWRPLGAKIKTPFEYVASGLRAFQVPKSALLNLKPQEYRKYIVLPMQLMGQKLFEPPGPDGWPEDPEAWMTPATLAGRLQWAMQVADRAQSEVDPRAFLDTAIGQDRASKALRFAVQASENKQEAIALVLASPEFNRR